MAEAEGVVKKQSGKSDSFVQADIATSNIVMNSASAHRREPSSCRLMVIERFSMLWVMVIERFSPKFGCLGSKF